MRRNDEGGNDPCNVGPVKVTVETDQALRVEPVGENPYWVPKSVIHDDSEVYKQDDEGDLIVKQWWASKQGLA